MGLLDYFFSGTPSRDKFAQHILDELRRRGETRQLDYDATRFRIAVAGGSFMNLTNGYQEYCQAPAGKREDVLKRFLSAWSAPERTQLPEAFEDVHPDLLPVVRSRFYYAAADLQGRAQGGKGMNIPQQVLGDHLCVSLVYDLPTAMRSIGQDDLDKWEVTFYEALEASRRNLEQMGQIAFQAIDNRIYVSANRDNYDASRLLLIELVRRLEVRGEPLALVPNRDTFIITGSEDDEGLQFMLAAAEKSFNEPRPISPVPLVLREDEWVTWQPPRDSSLAGEFRSLKLRSLGAEYNDQKELLDDLHRERKQDIFVASFKAYEEPQHKQVRSFCLWMAGVESFLPETDEVHFYRPGPNNTKGEVLAVIPWRRVRDLCRDLLEPLDVYPQRYRVRDFPTAELVERLKAK